MIPSIHDQCSHNHLSASYFPLRWRLVTRPWSEPSPHTSLIRLIPHSRSKRMLQPMLYRVLNYLDWRYQEAPAYLLSNQTFFFEFHLTRNPTLIVRNTESASSALSRAASDLKSSIALPSSMSSQSYLSVTSHLFLLILVSARVRRTFKKCVFVDNRRPYQLLMHVSSSSSTCCIKDHRRSNSVKGDGR